MHWHGPARKTGPNRPNPMNVEPESSNQSRLPPLPVQSAKASSAPPTPFMLSAVYRTPPPWPPRPHWFEPEPPPLPATATVEPWWGVEVLKIPTRAPPLCDVAGLKFNPGRSKLDVNGGWRHGTFCTNGERLPCQKQVRSMQCKRAVIVMEEAVVMVVVVGYGRGWVFFWGHSPRV